MIRWAALGQTGRVGPRNVWSRSTRPLNFSLALPALDPESDDFLPHPLAIGPGKVESIPRTGKRFGKGCSPSGTRGRSRSPAAWPPNVGEEQIADLWFLVERGLDLRKRVLQIPVLVGKGKRGTDLLEACGVLPLAQEPVGLQGSRERKTPGIEIRQPPRQEIVSRARGIPLHAGTDSGLFKHPLKGSSAFMAWPGVGEVVNRSPTSTAEYCASTLQ
jgi:hypothetical protein